MSMASKEKRPVLPPDETFWQRYSPHHEMPLAAMTSFFVHGLMIGSVVLVALALMLHWESETNKPPSMDMVQIADGGDGFEGMGGEPDLPGAPNSQHTELVPNPMTDTTETLPAASLKLNDAPPLELNIPEINSSDTKTDVESIFAKLEKDAADQAKADQTRKENLPTKKTGKIAPPGSGNPRGTAGQAGAGGGSGKGIRGTGLGTGGPGGRKATQAEIYAWRWRFELTGTGKDHASKLAAIGVTLAVQAPQGNFWFVQDLRRRPVSLQPGSLEKFKDAVQWQNTEPGSLLNLAGELKLPFIPPMVKMLLPKDREEKMAAEELRFAQKMGIPPQQIQATWFDFRLRDGVYEPVAIRQQ